jgi:hypothetical protein
MSKFDHNSRLGFQKQITHTTPAMMTTLRQEVATMEQSIHNVREDDMLPRTCRERIVALPLEHKVIVALDAEPGVHEPRELNLDSPLASRTRPTAWSYVWPSLCSPLKQFP